MIGICQRIAVAATLSIVAMPGAHAQPNAPGTSVVFAKQRGVSWVGSHEITEADLRPLLAANVGWIVQTPFGWQDAHDSPQVRLATGGHILWGESDVGLITTTRLARGLGLKTLLKPHIWLTRPAAGVWHGQIEMRGEEDWRRWFDSYRAFILHYARLAQEHGMEGFCIGTELHLTAVKRPSEWRRLIADVRAVYRGPLVYAANWRQEFEEIEFWDALDFIGVQAYFPLADGQGPTLERLKEGWRRHLPAIERIRARFGKPVLFTEVGYRSAADAAIEPWKWPRRGAPPDDEAGLRTQDYAYQAFFETFWDKDWVAGAYIWKWHPSVKPGGPPRHGDFSPQNKPAEKTLTRWYALDAN